MNPLSLISGINSLNRIAVISGLFLIIFGIVYPIQQLIILSQKVYVLNENIDLYNYDFKSLNEDLSFQLKTNKVLKVNFTNYEKIIDSLLKERLDDNIKFKINYFKSEEIRLEKNFNSEYNVIIERGDKQAKSKIKIDRLNGERIDLDRQIKTLKIIGIGLTILGSFLFIGGLASWFLSQNESDYIRKIETEIKKEELKKLLLENKKNTPIEPPTTS